MCDCADEDPDACDPQEKMPWFEYQDKVIDGQTVKVPRGLGLIFDVFLCSKALEVVDMLHQHHQAHQQHQL